jgi:L-arabinose transport system substrate-binding protein
MTSNLLRTLLTATIVGVLLLAGCSKGGSGSPIAAPPAKIKIGFIVKDPTEPWFQLEWRFADQAASDLGFDLVKIGATDGEKVLDAINTLAADGAQGFVICSPDVKLGPSIVKSAAEHNLKLMSVDDQFVGADGQPMAGVHYLGLSAHKIGEAVGAALYAEMQVRKWPLGETALCAVTFEELPTAKERVDGVISALTAAGFPADRIYRAPQKANSIPGAFDAVNVLLVQHPEVKHWLICGLNDNAVLGGVRSTEGRGFTADNVIGIGINGSEGKDELAKTSPTGFFASNLNSARQHGYDTAKMLFEWIKDNKEPPLDTRTFGVIINRSNFRQVLKEQGVE